MENRDWERFGEEIRRNVQDAIDSHDYSMLNRTISDTVNGAVDYVSHTMRGVGNTVNENIRTQQEQAAQRRRQEEEQRQRAEAQRKAQAQGTAAGGGYRYQGEDYKSASGSLAYRNQTASVYGSVAPTRIGGTLLAIFGYGIGGISVICLLLVLVVGLATGDMSTGFRGALALMAVPAVIFGILAGVGTRKLGKAHRFRTYIRILGGREYCDIKELQDQSGKNKKFIVQDIEEMIQKGWFKQGHLDSKKTCLMVTDKAYSQYTDLMNRVELEEREKKQKAREEKKKQAQDAQSKNKLSPEVQAVIDAGEAYILKIRACNDAIPGEEISAKISRIEMLVDKIFDRVEQNPDTVSDIRRMMEYYLPTTVKLLEAYEELDKQPAQGENIISSKVEIEKTLDTLNIAFEKLLDSLFQDTAWDVSSDISVLHTMLAQEGLTEDGLKK